MSEQRPNDLRRKAEQQLAARARQIESLEHGDLVSLAHELAVHQIELEIQNEELVRTRALAEEARDRYLDLYDFAPVGYFTLDEHSRIVEANLTGCRLLNAERRALLQTRFTKFLPEEEADRFYFHRRKALEGVVQQTCELKMQKADGAAFDARLESIRAGEGRLRVAVIDVTARKRAEETLRELTRTLESKVGQRTAELKHRARQLQKLTLELSLAEDRERRRIAQILHDDLQQMLVAAKFHLELLKNRAAQDPAQQAIAAEVGEMLKDAIAKSRGLSHELNPAALHQNDLAAILAYLASQMRAKHGLTVHVDAPGEMRLQSEAVAIFLFRAAQELLFNAVKHAGVNEARIRVRRRGGYISLSVSDRGRGFDSHQQRETDGFGLFSIVERAELLGGRMRIRSHPGQGSTFRIVVPAQEAAGADVKMDWEPLGRAAESRHTQDQDASQLRVLVADDHQIVRQAIVALLAEEDDVEVVAEATTGREAVELAEQLHPDVVVMDVTMPVMNGEEATRQIKRHLPQIRIVAVSMRNAAETIDRMTQAGADCHISKIASVEELLAAIRHR